LGFREMEKEHLQVLAPTEIVTLVREKAARERMSLSAATTELLCVALARDPGQFGLKHVGKRTRPRAVASVAS
jgi:hypothetical protein